MVKARQNTLAIKRISATPEPPTAAAAWRRWPCVDLPQTTFAESRPH